MTHTPPTFSSSDSVKWKSYLEEEGYVVLHNILTPKRKQNTWNNLNVNGQEFQLVSVGMIQPHILSSILL